MKRSSHLRLGVVAAGLALLSPALVGSVASSTAGAAARGSDEPLVEAFGELDRTTAWELRKRIALDFPTYHPQGFALVDKRIFMSTVEIIENPVKFPEPQNGFDRTPGKGVGHVLVMTRSGKLLKDITLGKGHMYHPGGIDFDGHNVCGSRSRSTGPTAAASSTPSTRPRTRFASGSAMRTTSAASCTALRQVTCTV